MKDANRDEVRQRLETLGFVVTPIAAKTKSLQPDLVARVDGVTMYVEVKTRSEDRVLRASLEAVRIGETTQVLTDLDKHNSLSAEIEHASRQLSAAALPDEFRLLWYRADTGPFVHGTKEQIGSTLYGMRMVLADSPAFGVRPWHCAYTAHADFHRFKDIDGAVVEEDGLISLFLNPFSPRRAAFASSHIARAVQGSTFDIEQAVREGKLFAADGDAPRNDDRALLAHLAAKYHGVTFVRFVQHYAGTNMTTIDGSRKSNEPPEAPT